MSLAHLNRRLDQRFRLLTGGARTALPRQRTLRATMDWSFELLSRAEQATLARLSVFFGSFELEAAEAVCATAATPGDEVADIIGSLVNKSLVVAEHSSGTLRYGLLETVRQYGAERLRAYGGEAELHRARAAHADFYLQFVEQIGTEAIGPHQARILKRLDLEWDNVRAALAYFLAEPDRTDEVLRLGSALSYFLVTRWHRYGIDATRTALARNGPVSARAKAKALCRIGHAMARTLGWECEADLQAARLLMQQGLGIARDLGDRKPLLRRYWATFPGLSTGWGTRLMRRPMQRRALRVRATWETIGSSAAGSQFSAWKTQRPLNRGVSTSRRWHTYNERAMRICASCRPGAWPGSN